MLDCVYTVCYGTKKLVTVVASGKGIGVEVTLIIVVSDKVFLRPVNSGE